MKKVMTIVGAILIASVLMIGCGETGNSINNSESQLEGKFVLEGMEESYMVFNADGTGEENSSQGLEKFEWKKTEGKLCIVKLYQLDESSEPIKSEESCGNFELSNNKLTWEVAGVTINLEKKN
jgi:hypothetical protein